MKYKQQVVYQNFYWNLSPTNFSELEKNDNTFYQVNGVGIYKGTKLICGLGSGGGGSADINNLIKRVTTLPVADSTSPDFVEYNNQIYYKKVSGDTSNYELILDDNTNYAADAELILNQKNFQISLQLKDKNGGNIGSKQTIDLPLESVVVDGRYNTEDKTLTLILQNGNEITFSVEDLVAGLQPTLISGVNIKTINGQSILGAGELEISGLKKSDLIEKTDILPNATADSSDLVMINTNGNLYRKYIYLENNVTKYKYDLISDTTEINNIKESLNNKVSKTEDEEISGIKNFTGEVKINNSPVLTESTIIPNNGEATTENLDSIFIKDKNYKIEGTKVVANNGNPAEEILSTLFVGNKNYLVSVNEKVKTLIWTNQDTTAPFDEINLPVELVNYDLFILVTRCSTTSTVEVSNVYNRDNLTYRTNASYEGYSIYRDIQISNAAFRFGKGYKISEYNGALIEDNTVAIPYQLYGLKLKVNLYSTSGADVVANPTGLGTEDLKKLKVDDIIYNIRGTEVKANPENAQVPLSAIEIDGSKYLIESAASIPIERL